MLPRTIADFTYSAFSRPASGFRHWASVFLAIGLLVCLSPREALAAILEPLSASLTEYKPSATTNVQDIRPLANQRGVGLDGALRLGGALPWHLAGNPFESGGGSGQLAGVRLDMGTAVMTDIDMALPAPGFSWIIARSYNARQHDGSSYFNSNGYQGSNWFQMSQPELVYHNPGGDSSDMVYLVYGADRYIEFKWVANGTTPDDITFKAVNGAAGVLVVTINASAPDLAVYTDQHGNQATFFWVGDADIDDDVEGSFWKFADPAGNTAYVGHSSNASTAISSGFDASTGAVLKAYDNHDDDIARRYTYDYDGNDRLIQVVAETKDPESSWADPDDVTAVATVDYSYYGDESYGEDGDLKLVTITTPLTDSGLSLIRKKYYRYYEGGSNNHLIQYIYDFEGTRRYDIAVDSLLNGDFLTASEADLKPYATAYFEYETTDRRITATWQNGACGCAGASTGMHEFAYADDSAAGGWTSSYQTAWYYRTVVGLPAKTDTPTADPFSTHYFDELGQPLSQILSDADPTGAPNFWVTEVVRDSTGCVTHVHSPANNTGYTHSSGAITHSSSVGLVNHYKRVTSGETTGFVQHAKFREGHDASSGNYTLGNSTFYTTETKTVGGSSVVRPLKEVMWTYTAATTTEASSSSGPGGANKTSLAYTFHAGDAALMTETITTTLPTVSTGNNGSGSSNTRAQYLNSDGRIAFQKSEDGIITFWEYTNGQLTRKIEDADTASLSPPTGFDSSGTELNRTTIYAYTRTGGGDFTTSDGLTRKSYYSKLADGRYVIVQFPHFVDGAPNDTFYGPATYMVNNLAGRTEVQAEIAFIGGTWSASATTGLIDESDDDPITAVDQGTLTHMTASVFDESGTELQEARQYFDVPGTWPGSPASSYYDSTFFGYDNAGRQWRVVDATGTIERTKFDKIGRFENQWIGTHDDDDSDFPGNDGSTIDNMVKVLQVQYGGSAGKNSLVTSQTDYLDGTGSPATRVIGFSHDFRGNVLLQTNPTAPHEFNKFDNQRRPIAGGLFSATGSITPGSDDPTTETTNRLALSQTFFDEMGRAWKSQVHKITQSSGADADNVQELTWRDPAGRVIKVDGQQLVKHAFDRLGRPIRQHVLASDNDAAATYGDVYDSSSKIVSVTGDVVLEEQHTVYESGSSDDVVMTAMISRYHTDYGGGQTTGALDTNADGDLLMFTAGNVKGRISITGMWYDTLNRVTTMADYGQYDDDTPEDDAFDTFDRDGLAEPSTFTDTRLLTLHVYNNDGTVQQITDPREKIARFEYDDAGRQTKATANYVNGTPGGGTNDDEDQVTIFAYETGQLKTQTADLPSGTDQVTTYTYDVTTADSPGASTITSNRLLRQVAYPDSSGGSDVVRFAYNALGEEIWMQDQAGNVIQTDFDGSGRIIHKRASTIGGSFDDAVQRISTTYDNLGRAQLVTQYDDDAPGSGSETDEVKLTYDDWGNLEKFEQDHDSDIGGGGVGDYETAFTYAKATTGRNTVRRSGMTMPNGASVSYSYASAGGLHDDAASRVTAIVLGNNPVALYQYNGLGHVVRTDLPEPDAYSSVYSGTAGIYSDLDRFDRPRFNRWTKDLTTDIDFYRYEVTHDRNSNIERVDDQVYPGFATVLTLDGLNRLTNSEEGTWTGSAISPASRLQTWKHSGASELDQVGNWTRVKLNLNAGSDGDFTDANEYDDTRTHNVVNELTGQDTDTSGTDNYTLTWNALGQLTDDAKNWEFTWDAFGRLREVRNTSNQNLLAEYRYNGLGQRITWKYDSDVDGDVDGSDKTYHLVYDTPEDWRVVAVYRESDASPKEQYLPHNAGLDGLGGSLPHDNVILRDKDANTAWTSASDGTLEQRRYLLANWRGDMVAVIRHDGTELFEQARYSGYGVPIGIPGGDCNGDGTVNGFDQAIVLGAYAPSYEARADLNLDGVVDSFDLAILLANWGNTLGWDKLSLPGVFNRRSYAGYELDGSLSELYHVRHRVLQSRLGRWISRDSLGYVDGMNLYEYGQSNPWANVDPTGLASFAQDTSPPSVSPGGHHAIPTEQIPAPGCNEGNPYWPCCFPCFMGPDQTPICPYPAGICGGGGGICAVSAPGPGTPGTPATGGGSNRFCGNPGCTFGSCWWNCMKRFTHPLILAGCGFTAPVTPFPYRWIPGIGRKMGGGSASRWTTLPSYFEHRGWKPNWFNRSFGRRWSPFAIRNPLCWYLVGLTAGCAATCAYDPCSY